MHTGIEEAVNLGWKLAALVEGWGGPQLLASYESERRPVALRNVAIATRIYGQLRAIPGLTAETETETHGWRAKLGGFSISEQDKMTYAYDSSPIVISEGTSADEDGRSSARAGMRAPHAWLPDGRSTLDLFGNDFALMCFEGQDRAGSLLRAAREAAVPMSATYIDDADIAALYGTAMVLVRPDGHIAWRGDTADDPKAIVSRCRGA
jgi:hypothetical protein